jgi:hypothetical protein
MEGREDSALVLLRELKQSLPKKMFYKLKKKWDLFETGTSQDKGSHLFHCFFIDLEL